MPVQTGNIEFSPSNPIDRGQMDDVNDERKQRFGNGIVLIFVRGQAVGASTEKFNRGRGSGLDWREGSAPACPVVGGGTERNGTLRSCAPLLTPATLPGDLLSLIWWALWNGEGDEGGGGKGGMNHERRSALALPFKSEREIAPTRGEEGVRPTPLSPLSQGDRHPKPNRNENQN